MKSFVRVVLAISALTLAACGGKSSGDTAGNRVASGCTAAAANITAMIPDLEPGTEGHDAVVTAIADSCEADGWSAEATSCFSDAADDDAMRPCGDKLTPAQQQALAEKMAANAAAEDAEDAEPSDDGMGEDDGEAEGDGEEW